ncbi:MAG: hypothetical protein IT425_11260 [Pirellulales bacterium]|nr:hypothetical protein [Pirellulales bacterium]
MSMLRELFRIADFGFRISDCRPSDVIRPDPQSAIRNPRFTVLLAWLGLGALAAVFVGWLAARLHAWGPTPVGLIALGAGVLLALAIRWLATVLGINRFSTLVVGVLVLALLAIVAEHAWLYQDFRAQWREAREKSAMVALFRPVDPPEAKPYFSHEFNGPLWCFDAAVLVVAAIGTIAVGRRGL